MDTDSKPAISRLSGGARRCIAVENGLDGETPVHWHVIRVA